MKAPLFALTTLVCIAAADLQASRLHPYVVAGDAIAVSLTGQVGDAVRGARLMQQRQKSLCVLCHTGPFPDPQLQGTIAPDLTGVASRLSAGQLRLRIVDMKRLNPASIMPAYYATVPSANASRIAPEWRDKPILQAGEIEDLVAYLETLK